VSPACKQKHQTTKSDHAIQKSVAHLQRQKHPRPINPTTSTFLSQKLLTLRNLCWAHNHRRSQGPATLGSWPGSHGTAEAGRERKVRTQDRRPVRGGRRRGREATGERREGEPLTSPPSLVLPLRRRGPEPERREGGESARR